MRKIIKEIDKNNAIIVDLVLQVLESNKLPRYVYSNTINDFSKGYLEYERFIQIKIYKGFTDDFILQVKIYNGPQWLTYTHDIYYENKNHVKIIDLYKNYINEFHKQFLTQLQTLITNKIKLYNN